MPERRAERQDFADEAIAHQLSCLAVCLRQPLILVNHQLTPAAPRSHDHFFAVFKRGRHRFLAQDMLARIEGGYGVFCMRDVRHAHADRINVFVPQHFFQRHIRLASEFRGKRLRPGEIQIVIANDFTIWVLTVFQDVPDLRNFAAAYDSYFYHREY